MTSGLQIFKIWVVYIYVLQFDTIGWHHFLEYIKTNSYTTVYKSRRCKETVTKRLFALVWAL